MVVDLECHDIEVADGRVQKGALQRVEDCGDGEFPAVACEYRLIHMFKPADDRRRGLGACLIVEGEGNANDKLDHLGQENCGGREVALLPLHRRDSRIVQGLEAH